MSGTSQVNANGLLDFRASQLDRGNALEQRHYPGHRIFND